MSGCARRTREGWARAASAVARSAALIGCATLIGCASLDAPQTRALLAADGLSSEARKTASAPTFRRLAHAMQPRRVLLDAVPFHPQAPLHCGPAALATVLNFAGVAVTPDALAARVFVPAREGSLQIEMLAAVRAHGAVAVELPGTLTALMDELAAGRPVVVLLNLGLSWAPRWHYAVVVGYDLDARSFTLRSGEEREQVMGFNTFEHTWARSAHWMVATIKAGDPWPQTAREEDAQRAAAATERHLSPPDRRAMFSALRQRWPQNLVALLGLGNAALGDKRNDEAITWLLQASAIHQHPAALNNLAVAYARKGDAAMARSAALTAVDVARRTDSPLLSAARETLAQLQRGEVP